MKNLIVVLLAMLLFSGCTSYDLQTDKSYDPANVPFGVYDVYYPKGPLFGLIPDTSTHSAVVAIHGGAWQGGNKSDMQGLAQDLCAQGYIVLSPNYRLTSSGTWGSGSPWPAQVNDLQKAVAYFRANAKQLRIDPTKMASLGVSAGGHLATMLGVRPDPLNGNKPTVDVAVDLDGEQDMTMPGNLVMANFYDLTNPPGPGIMTLAMGHPQPWSQAELQDISPVHFAYNANPNVLIVHGQGDTNVYVANATWIENALLSNPMHGYVKKVIITGSDGNCHGQCWEVPVADQAIHDFLGKFLK